ncbi:MAG: chemotaxis protein MotB [Magnetovibrio sp.]|nr:chemotaxis protein MotB [Magnetovibrio sp.]
MAWMVVFTDLVSLMLTFFVLIFSMSSVKMDKWKEMTDALSQNLNPSITKSVATATAKFNISTIFRKRAINLDYLTAVLERAVNQDPLLKRSLLMRLEDRLIIALPGDLLFQPGRAVMTERARDALFTLGGVLRNIGNQIGVNGHSDPVPPQGGEYASNWELSIARAVAVTNALKRSGYTEDIIAYGYSDSLYSQLPDVTEEQRQAMGRRVDIMVLPNVGD